MGYVESSDRSLWYDFPQSARRTQIEMLPRASTNTVTQTCHFPLMTSKPLIDRRESELAICQVPSPAGRGGIPEKFDYM